MPSKIEIETTQKERQVSPARVSSKARGRPIADLVERFERAGTKFSSESLSSAALRAGDLVREMRKAAEISQAELASRMGVSQSRISEIEAGMGSQGPTWDVMERVAEACGKRFEISEQVVSATVKSTGKERIPSLAPWRPLETLRREIDRLFDDFGVSKWRSPLGRRRESAWPAASAVDLAESENAYEITAKLPNLDEKNLEVRLVNGVLTIKGEEQEQNEVEKKKLSRHRIGSFQRDFQVPNGINADEIRATFKKGVLTVTLPKSMEVQQVEKSIAVNAA